LIDASMCMIAGRSYTTPEAMHTGKQHADRS